MIQATFDKARVMRQPHFYEYAGLSHEAASRIGQRLCAAAAETGCWRHLPEHLTVLREALKG
jgi:hypothetical protein